jgi:hypothetical protein
MIECIGASLLDFYWVVTECSFEGSAAEEETCSPSASAEAASGSTSHGFFLIGSVGLLGSSS